MDPITFSIIRHRLFRVVDEARSEGEPVKA